MPDFTQGALNGRGLKVAVICSRFNQEVTERLYRGALEALENCGVEAHDVLAFKVPGAIEIPLLAMTLARGGEVDAIVALGAVIRGETAHFDHVCSMAADGCMRVSLDTGIPVSFGVLTCDTGNQALARATGGRENKGYEAALVALEMANLLKDVPSS